MGQSDSIASYCSKIEQWSVRNFGDSHKCPPELAALGLAEEVGEVCRALIKRKQGIRGTREEWTLNLAKELADTFIKVVDVANRAGLDLPTIVEERWVEVEMRDWLANPRTGI